MYQIDNPTAAAARPASTAAGSAGWFTDGNPAGNVAATIVPAEWLNMVQAELINIPGAAGIALNKATSNQVLAALIAMFAPPAGTVRNAKMSVTAASASGTFTADQIVVAAALNGQPFLLANFNQTINLATTGAGGMDTGAAPASGFVALYAIYNPTTQTASIIATNATSVVAPTIYGGANMPAGYTASALIGVWPTNASGQFVVGAQVDREFYFVGATAVSTTSAVSTLTAVNASSIIPKNARRVSGWMGIVGTAMSNGVTEVAATSAGVGAFQSAMSSTTASDNDAIVASFKGLPIITSQTFYWTSSVSSGTFGSASVVLSAYEI
jgi:hypothetical protein